MIQSCTTQRQLFNCDRYFRLFRKQYKCGTNSKNLVFHHLWTKKVDELHLLNIKVEKEKAEHDEKFLGFGNQNE